MDAKQLEDRVSAHNYAPLDVTLVRGLGVWVWDDTGKRYLDMMSAYSAVSCGHSHPRLVAALTEQANRIAVPSRAYRTDRLGPFLAELTRLAGLDRALPMNTGAEAVETAIKAARRWGHDRRGVKDGAQEIIVAAGNFHGRTTTIVGFSSEPSYRRGFGPFAPGFVTVPFGDAAAIKRAITPNTVAVLVEPIQGEAGIVLPPDGYLAALRAMCTQAGILLIFDEVQSGLGRTGRMFAFEHEDARPDGLIVGKALGGGLLPVSAFISTNDVMDVFDPGSHGSTFGGNPLAAAVGLEALRVLQEEDLVERSRDLGAYLLDGARALTHPAIRAVRGRGLWVGIDLDPTMAPARQICEALARRGVLSKETHETVIRLAPPLTIERAEIDFALTTLAEALNEIAPQPRKQERTRIVMCPPSRFEVAYCINPWMAPARWSAERMQLTAAASNDWTVLRNTLEDCGAEIDIVPPEAGLPDLVFTANAAVVLDGVALVARFRHAERQGEEIPYRHAFEKLRDQGKLRAVRMMPDEVVLEGAGDCVWDAARNLFWVGYGPRSDRAAADVVARTFGVEALPIELVDPRFYHMDTALLPLPRGEVVYVPSAFSAEGMALLTARVGTDKLIPVPDADAVELAANAVVLGDQVVLGSCSDEWAATLATRGYRVRRTGLAPFRLSGGSAWCLTLRLDLTSADRASARRAA
ncbi:MAG: ornithine--oxo-acid transaminase [Rhodospirillales bacterium]|nr:ornithine--oxo-acid transaminase [Rhodospirillales bacterium]